jgi:hypothetical protein
MTGQPGISAAIDRVISALGALADALEQDAAPAGFLERHPRPVRGPKIIPVKPHYPYGRSKHGRYHAASPAEAGYCGAHSEPQYVQDPTSYCICELPAGHAGDHAVHEADGRVFLRWPQDAASPAGAAGSVDTTCTRIRPDNGTYRCKRHDGHDGSHEDITGHRWAEKYDAASPAEVAEGAEPGTITDEQWHAMTPAERMAWLDHDDEVAAHAPWCPAFGHEPSPQYRCNCIPAAGPAAKDGHA